VNVIDVKFSLSAARLACFSLRSRLSSRDHDWPRDGGRNPGLAGAGVSHRPIDEFWPAVGETEFAAPIFASPNKIDDKFGAGAISAVATCVS
jgi:hypothetical protein